MDEEEIVEEVNIWVIFDGYGEMLFYTHEEIYANFNNMYDSEYNKEKCSIELNVPGFTGLVMESCQKDMETGIITIIQRPRDYTRVKPHIPAP
jgi:hypothetical protein